MKQVLLGGLLGLLLSVLALGAAIGIASVLDYSIVVQEQKGIEAKQRSLENPSASNVPSAFQSSDVLLLVQTQLGQGPGPHGAKGVRCTEASYRMPIRMWVVRCNYLGDNGGEVLITTRAFAFDDRKGQIVDGP